MADADFSKCWYKGVCAKNCSQSCIRYLEMKYLVRESGLPIMYQYPIPLQPDDADYDSFERLMEIKETVVDFVSSGGGLYICGKHTGIGKTTWASKFLLKYFDEVWAGNGFRIRGLFLHVPSILLKFKDFDNKVPELFKQSVLTADLVVWDDIGAGGLSNYDFTQLFTYVGSRILNGRANIYTSNIVSSVDLQRVVGSRLASRIWNKSEVVILYGKDKRSA